MKQSLFKDPNRLFPFGNNLFPGQVLIERVGYRPPKRGELYLSGALPTVYKAVNDERQEQVIIRAFKPGPKKVITYDRGDEIK